MTNISDVKELLHPLFQTDIFTTYVFPRWQSPDGLVGLLFSVTLVTYRSSGVQKCSTFPESSMAAF
ncbi:hypothetical protein GZ77_23660 [Endozoicomonas montiporae]|uniref:Uncharacterized protein n=2 Tax=Endozoicomonas montiporae TaxID=1027273 RepID=A0A081N0V1_9GAMM|nr:hypothetical protein EZMO1_0293 [Endozoicomonas montiporae CL-33]KEQ12074.1 hypothetical protein GZ77_23660 [Endozoicomonas montiporae]